MAHTILALDPSMGSTGFAYFVHAGQYPPSHGFFFGTIKTKGACTDFCTNYRKGIEQIRRLSVRVGDLPDIAAVIQETPPPVGQSAPGLFLIGALCGGWCLSRGLEPILVHPHTVKTLVGTGKKYDKSDIKVAVKEIVELNGLVPRRVDEGALTNLDKLLTDEADALFLLFYLLYNRGEIELKLPARFSLDKWLLKEGDGYQEGQAPDGGEASQRD